LVGCGERANRIARGNSFAARIAFIADPTRRDAGRFIAVTDYSIDAVRSAYRILRGLSREGRGDLGRGTERLPFVLLWLTVFMALFIKSEFNKIVMDRKVCGAFLHDETARRQLRIADSRTDRALFEVLALYDRSSPGGFPS
jgi:hypothetical protein